MSAWIAALAVLGLQTADVKPLSTGAQVTLTNNLGFEQPTIFVFYKPSSSLEKDFFEAIRKSIEGKNVTLEAIQLKSGDEPIAKQYEITQTPAALVYDRRGRQTVKATNAEEIVAAVKKASDVQRIDWVMDVSDPLFQRLKQLGAPFQTPTQIPAIMRTMSLRPEVMGMVNQLASRMHFSDGALTRREKEMIATYVSALNKCKY